MIILVYIVFLIVFSIVIFLYTFIDDKIMLYKIHHHKEENNSKGYKSERHGSQHSDNFRRRKRVNQNQYWQQRQLEDQMLWNQQQVDADMYTFMESQRQFDEVGRQFEHQRNYDDSRWVNDQNQQQFDQQMSNFSDPFNNMF